VIATAVLLEHMSTVSFFANIAAEAAISEVRGVLGSALRGELFHAGMGLVVLLAIESLNVYKPRGLTAYGRRLSQGAADSGSQDVVSTGLGRGAAPSRPR
jgi:hypothetical protein